MCKQENNKTEARILGRNIKQIGVKRGVGVEYRKKANRNRRLHVKSSIGLLPKELKTVELSSNEKKK